MNIEKLHMLQPIHFQPFQQLFTHTIQSLIQIQPHPDVGYATQIAIQIRAFTETFLWIVATLE